HGTSLVGACCAPEKATLLLLSSSTTFGRSNTRPTYLLSRGCACCPTDEATEFSSEPDSRRDLVADRHLPGARRRPIVIDPSIEASMLSAPNLENARCSYLHDDRRGHTR